ncbi:MAG TPA: cobalamin-binding protein [Burkholderiales bacterium]|nr:cobalamin-binding protein [Burkholderiales bacterium]
MAWTQAAPAAQGVDDRGVMVRLAAPAARIVTLAPHLAEIAFAAGAGEKLVGAVRFSDFPAAAQRLLRVGDAASIDVEGILLLQPDLVLAWKSGNRVGDVARLERLGLRVYVTEPLRLSDVPRLIRAVGALGGTTQSAQSAARAFERRIAALRAQFARRRPLRVFYEIWHRPLLTVNGGHMISDVIALCGGVNVFSDAPLLTPSVSLESVLAARPDAIVGGGSGVTAQEFMAQWRAHGIGALRDMPLIYITPDEIQRATPRIADGARAICDGLEQVRSKQREETGNKAPLKKRE